MGKGPNENKFNFNIPILYHFLNLFLMHDSSCFQSFVASLFLPIFSLRFAHQISDINLGTQMERQWILIVVFSKILLMENKIGGCMYRVGVVWCLHYPVYGRLQETSPFLLLQVTQWFTQCCTSIVPLSGQRQVGREHAGFDPPGIILYFFNISDLETFSLLLYPHLLTKGLLMPPAHTASYQSNIHSSFLHY